MCMYTIYPQRITFYLTSRLSSSGFPIYRSQIPITFQQQQTLFFEFLFFCSLLIFYTLCFVKLCTMIKESSLFKKVLILFLFLLRMCVLILFFFFKAHYTIPSIFILLHCLAYLIFTSLYRTTTASHFLYTRGGTTILVLVYFSLAPINSQLSIDIRKYTKIEPCSI